MKKFLFASVLSVFLCISARAGLYDDCVFITNMQFNGDTSDIYNYYIRPPASGIGFFITDPSLSNTGNMQGTITFASPSARFVYTPLTETVDIDVSDKASISSLGSAAFVGTGTFATAAQGTKADSALQPAAIGVSIQAFSLALGTFASNGSAYYLNRANHTGTQSAATITGLATVATSGAYSDLSGKPSLATVATSGAYSDLTGKPSLATVATTGAYADLTGKPSIPAAQVNSDWNAVSGVAQILNKPTITSGTVTSVGVSSTGGTLTVTSSPITSSGTINVETRARSFNNAATLTLVTSPTGQGGVVVDTSRDAAVTYSVNTSTTATIGGASTVTVYLEIATTNSATASDWTAIQTVSNSQTITLAIVLQSVQANTLPLSGVIPAGYYRRVRYATTGTASASYVSGQEVKL